MNITGVMMFCWEAPSPTDLGLSSITLFALHNGRRPESEECAALIVTINDRSVGCGEGEASTVSVARCP